MKFRMEKVLLLILAFAFCSLPLQAQYDAPVDDQSDTTEQLPSGAEELPPAPATIVVRMRNNKFLQGVPIDLVSIDIYILGNKVAVPIEEVLGVRFDGGEKSRGTIALKNGDTLIGRMEAPKIVLSVDWGEASIDAEAITSIVRDRSMQWTMQNSPNGPQWFLSPGMNRTPTDYYSPTVVPKVDTPTPAILPSSGSYRDGVAPASFGVSLNSVESKAFPLVDPREFSWIW